MWALILVGIFSGAVRGPSMQVDSDELSVMVEMSGDVTISTSGFPTEESCRIQLAAAEHKHQFSMNGMTITVKSVECRNTEAKVTEGRGPRS